MQVRYYDIFEQGLGRRLHAYEVGLIGVRKKLNTNSFDDEFSYFWRSAQGELQSIVVNRFTTDAGFKSLENPQNVKGCAILKEGFYTDCWSIGTHKTYKALVQVRPVSVYRDNNKDRTHDIKSVPVDTGLFGINIHRANENGTSTIVDGWSAGCQVFADSNDFSKFIKLLEDNLKLYKQNFYSYLLLTETK